MILASDFTPNAGLAYRNGAALSFQPHPEFLDDYTVALAELRRGKAPDAVVDTALASIATPSHSGDVGGYIGQFFKRTLTGLHGSSCCSSRARAHDMANHRFRFSSALDGRTGGSRPACQ